MRALTALATGAVLTRLTLAGAAGAGYAPRAITTASAQEATTPPHTSGITVVGDGTAAGQPDTTTVRLGVQLTAPSAADALAQTRQRTEAVLQRLRERGVPESDLQTSGLNVHPVYGPPSDRPGAGGPGGPGQVTGYTGAATITVQVAAVDQVGPLLTAAVEAGANLVHGLGFGIRRDEPLRRQAITGAMADARPKAEAAAQAAGLTITGIRAVVEIPTGGPRGLSEASLGGGGGEGIAPGQLTVTARVQVTFDVTR